MTEVEALAVALGRKLKTLNGATQLEFPPPTVNVTTPEPRVYVTNEVVAPAPTVNVAVDLAPLVAMLEPMLTAVVSLHGEVKDLVAQLADLIGSLPRPIVRVAPAQVVVEPRIDVYVPPVAERPKRSLQITHADGTKSAVKEV